MTRELTDDMRRFLMLLEPHTLPVPRSQLRLFADRSQDKARQACKRLGYARYCGGFIDGAQRPMGWLITPAGRAAISQQGDRT